MDILIDILSEAVIDTLKLVPFLFVTYLVMEAIEHKAGEKAEEAIKKAGIAGPVVGSLLGIFPQCGFSAAAATFYAGRVVTLGTMIAVFLSTSDEMLPIFIAEQVDIDIILKILATKVVIGMVIGFVIDLVMRISRRKSQESMVIHELCEQAHCDCHDSNGNILKSALKHTIQVTVFIFLITLVLGGIIEFVGEDVVAAFLSGNEVFSVFASGLVGLVPNCAASVVIAELYLDGTLGSGAMMAGLLVASGVGLLVLFRTNKRAKENLAIVALLFVIGVGCGLVINALGIVF